MLSAAVTGFKSFLGGLSSSKEVEKDSAQQSTWETITSLTGGRESFVDGLKYEYGLGRDVATIQTAHGSSMFSAVEAQIARSRVDGDTESEAETAARSELSKDAATSIWNNIARWNDFYSSAAEVILYSITSDGVVSPETGSFTTLSNSRTDANSDNVEPIVTDDSGNIYVWSDPLSGPNVNLPDWMDLSQIEDKDVSTSDLHVIRFAIDQTVVDIINGTGVGTKLIAEHPDHGTQTVADPQLYADLVSTTMTLRDSLSADMTTIVSEIYQQFDIGEKDPSDIISNQELLQQFDSGGDLTEQSAVAALAARGYAVPDDLENQVTISHNDLEGETTGWLFVDATSEIVVGSETTISAADYQTSHIVYESEVDGSIQTQSLSGDYPLEIVEYSGGSTTNVDMFSFESDTNIGPQYLYIEQEQEELTDPESNVILQVTGAEDTISIPATQVEHDVNGYPHAVEFDTGKIDGQTFPKDTDHTVRIIQGLVYSPRSERHISDPTNPTETRNRVEDNREAWQAINDKLDGLANGGFGAGGGGGSLLGIGLVIAALAVIFGGGS